MEMLNFDDADKLLKFKVIGWGFYAPKNKKCGGLQNPMLQGKPHISINFWSQKVLLIVHVVYIYRCSISAS